MALICLRCFCFHHCGTAYHIPTVNGYSPAGCGGDRVNGYTPVGWLGVLAAQEDLQTALAEKASLQKRVEELKTQLRDSQDSEKEVAEDLQRELKRQSKAMEYRSFFFGRFFIRKKCEKESCQKHVFLLKNNFKK